MGLGSQELSRLSVLKTLYLRLVWKGTMNMRSKALIILLLSSFFTLAQRGGTSNEIGFFAAGTNFIGDVGHYGIHIPQGVAGGVFYRHQFNDRYAIRGQFAFGRIANDDQLSTLENRQFRNLHFRSNIYEGSVIGEVNFFQYRPGSSKYWHTPYLFAGAGITAFNPQAQYQDEWYDLAPLGTEGQRTSLDPGNYYPTATWTLPFGMGYKWNLGRTWCFGVELGFRRTYSDYIDDVSGVYADPDIIRAAHGDIAAALSNRTNRPNELIGYARGNNQNDDWYVFTGISISANLPPFIEKCTNFINR